MPPGRPGRGSPKSLLQPSTRHPHRADLQHGPARRRHRRPLWLLRRSSTRPSSTSASTRSTTRLIATVEGVPSASGLSEADDDVWGVPAARHPRRTAAHPRGSGRQTKPRPEAAQVRPAGNPLPLQPDRLHRWRARSRSPRAATSCPTSPRRKTAPFPPITGCGKLGFDPSLHHGPDQPRSLRPHRRRRDADGPPGRKPPGPRHLDPEERRGHPARGLYDQPRRRRRPRGLQRRPRSASAKRRPAHLPRRGEDRLGRNRGAGAGKDPATAPSTSAPPKPGRLFRFWLVTDEQGVHLKLPGRNRSQPADRPGDHGLRRDRSPRRSTRRCRSQASRCTSSADPGRRSATPGCGTYLTQYAFTPWSGRPAAVGDTPMQITSGCGKGGFSPAARGRRPRAFRRRLHPLLLHPDPPGRRSQPPDASPSTCPRASWPSSAACRSAPRPPRPPATCPAGSQIGTPHRRQRRGRSAALDPPARQGPHRRLPRRPLQRRPLLDRRRGPRPGRTLRPRHWSSTAPRSTSTPTTALATRRLPTPCRRSSKGCRSPTARSTCGRPPGIHAQPDQLQAEADHRRRSPPRTAGSPSPQTASRRPAARSSPTSPKLKLAFKGQTKRSGNPAVKAVLDPEAGQANIAATTVILPASRVHRQRPTSTTPAPGSSSTPKPARRTRSSATSTA